MADNFCSNYEEQYKTFSDVGRKNSLIPVFMLALILFLNQVSVITYSANTDYSIIEVNVRTVIDGKSS